MRYRTCSIIFQRCLTSIISHPRSRSEAGRYTVCTASPRAEPDRAITSTRMTPSSKSCSAETIYSHHDTGWPDRLQAPADRESRFLFPILVNKTLGGSSASPTRSFSIETGRSSPDSASRLRFHREYHLHQDSIKVQPVRLDVELNRAITPIQNYDTLLQMILDKSPSC